MGPSYFRHIHSISFHGMLILIDESAGGLQGLKPYKPNTTFDFREIFTQYPHRTMGKQIPYLESLSVPSARVRSQVHMHYWFNDFSKYNVENNVERVSKKLTPENLYLIIASKFKSK